LMLQPLVENAIRHGIAPRLSKGVVRVAARRDGNSLILDVQDDGVGLNSGGSSAQEGIGLKNTRSRLAELYEGAFDFSIGNRPKGGVEVRLVMPYRTA
jgi:two-component system LytT family sensor kinase